jgi:hypothetical protein
MAKHPFQRLRTPTMNATRLKTEPLAQDLGSTRPVLSAANSSGGLLSGLLQAILPGKGKSQRAAPRLVAEVRGDGQRREPYLFGQSRPTSDAAD